VKQRRGSLVSVAAVGEIYEAWLPKLGVSELGLLLRVLDPDRTGRVTLRTFVRTLAPGCSLQDGLDAVARAAEVVKESPGALDLLTDVMTADELWAQGKKWLKSREDCELVFRIVGCRHRIERAWLKEWLDEIAKEKENVYKTIFDEESESEESTRSSSSVYEEWPPKPSPRGMSLTRTTSAPAAGRPPLGGLQFAMPVVEPANSAETEDRAEAEPSTDVLPPCESQANLASEEGDAEAFHVGSRVTVETEMVDVRDQLEEASLSAISR
jgi:hypothetical protein